ncbi:MAG: hypothetical protein B9S33_04575 [Pedosphaera sp. Tous-C6FEB]|nr:MAG: hypothetical protein B9S33_04575 [Pedosphaera sp. Tous-C6FEB]
MLDGGVVVDERAGAGRCLVVRDPEAFAEFCRRLFPDLPTAPSVSSRVSGIAHFRDSKTYASDTPTVLTLRAWSDTALWRSGQPVPAAQATAAHGVFSFALAPGGQYELRAPCALVENPAMLLAFEQLGVTSAVPIALYAGGRVSERVLNWLAHSSAPGFRLVHFPDYDPVGMSEFVRVRAALGDRATLHLPAGLGEVFSRFANPDLLRREASQALLPALRNNPLPEVRAVLDLIEGHNAGLEQEALLIAAQLSHRND